jgi:hypothetical protein
MRGNNAKNKQQLFNLTAIQTCKKPDLSQRLHVQGCNSIMPAIKNNHQLNLSSIIAVSVQK